LRVFRRAITPIQIIAAGLAGPALAAAPPAPIQPAPAAAVAQPAPAPMPPAVIPALTPVKVEIRKQLVSKVNKPGEFFPLRLAAPILVDGVVAVPAGAEGMGEVVESKGGGMAGGAGILILAARYIAVDGRQLRLRSMHIAQSGTDNRAAVDAAMLAFGFFALPGLFVTGGKTAVGAGTIADAKTAEPFALGSTVNAPATAADTAAASAATATTTKPQVAAPASQTIALERKAQ
jgi:hypothetical protein